MRRCHEEVGQDDLGADALLRHHSAGSHGRRRLCQVEQCHEQAEGTETEGKLKIQVEHRTNCFATTSRHLPSYFLGTSPKVSLLNLV